MRARQVASASAHCVCSAEGRGARRAAAHTVGAGGDARTVAHMHERTRTRRVAVCAESSRATAAGLGSTLLHLRRDWARLGRRSATSAPGLDGARTRGRLGSSAVGVRWGRCCCARVPTRQRSARRPSSGCGRVRASGAPTLSASCCMLQHVASCCNIVRHVAPDRLSVQLRGRATRKRPSRSPRSASPPESPTETPTRRSAHSGSAWPSALPAA